MLYDDPFISPPIAVVNLKIDVSTLTTDEVDSRGYLKPGVPFRVSGTSGLLISAGSQVVYGVTREAQKMRQRTDNADLGTDTNDAMYAVETGGTINRDLAEDILGRAYSADEIAALAAGGFKLTTT